MNAPAMSPPPTRGRKFNELLPPPFDSPARGTAVASPLLLSPFAAVVFALADASPDSLADGTVGTSVAVASSSAESAAAASAVAVSDAESGVAGDSGVLLGVSEG